MAIIFLNAYWPVESGYTGEVLGDSRIRVGGHYFAVSSMNPCRLETNATSSRMIINLFRHISG